ncbi:hypothetical protein MMC07_004306 [Pseudocyphellaria aurata]|nr:hypothetical protein [Pseudocyphellaria aurata]
MHCQLLLLSFLAALASSASLQRRSESPWPRAVQDFFAEVGREVKAVKSSRSSVPRCDLSAAVLPTTTNSPLPPPSEGLTVYHVAIGRGTQNYTCPDANNSAAAPTAVGAVALLYNASCIAADRPKVLATIPAAALALPIPSEGANLFPGNLVESGHHYFPDPKTPTFNLHTAVANYGIYFATRVANTTAPEGSATGTNGSAAVPWLKLSVLPPPAGALAADIAGGVQEIYRVNTAGGSAPKTCEGQPAAFQVDYAAEYWFYAPSPST